MFLELFLFGQRQERFGCAGGKGSNTLFVTQPFGRLQPDKRRFVVQKVLPNAASVCLVLCLPRPPIRTELDASNLFQPSCHRECLEDHHKFLVALWWHFVPVILHVRATYCKLHI